MFIGIIGKVLNEVTMNKIKIMESSVRKWEKIIHENKSDGGVLDCPPCRIFYFTFCFGCPIAAYTGQKFCKGSPYGRWYWHQVNEHDKIRKKIYCPECLKLATEMRDFMKEIVASMKAQEAGQQ